MQMELIQKNWLKGNRRFQIEEQGLKIKESKLTASNELYLKFENIGYQAIESNSGIKGWLWSAITFVCLACGVFIFRIIGSEVEVGAEFIYLGLAVICLLIFIFTYKRVLFLVNSNNDGSYVEFHNNLRDRNDLNKFLELLMSKRKEFLIEKYCFLNKLRNYETQFDTITWLRNIEVLSTEEYKSWIQKLDNLFGQNGKIGFNG
jgi:hypothetical protein